MTENQEKIVSGITKNPKITSEELATIVRDFFQKNQGEYEETQRRGAY